MKPTSHKSTQQFSLAEMLFEAISDLGEISPNTARKAGLLALSSGRTHRAKSLFESAYELAPGHSTTLGLLEHVSCCWVINPSKGTGLRHR